MAVSNSQSISSNAPATSNGSVSGLSKLSNDFNSFLKLLTTQLQHQDPTNPTDTNEFTNQIVGFSQVEQQVKINTNLEKLLNQNKASSVGNSVAYIDKFVQADTDQFNIKGRKTILSYTLPTDAFSSVITVKDKAGNIVGTFNGGTAKGANSLAWDGKNLDGTEMEEGDYDFTVEAKNALGDAITASDLAHNKQPGAAILAYNLPRKAETATVSITDATGKVLASFEGKTAAGENKIAWDGKDSNGNVVPDGEYKFNIKAKDDKGVDITAQTLVTDLVTQVDLHGDSTTLYLDKIQVDLGKVISIKSGYAKI